MRILVVCTGNVCRSPMAAGFLRAGSAALALDAHVASAGVLASPGRPAEPDAVVAMRNWGIDLSGHSAHRLAKVDIGHAGLIVAMAREHLMAVVSSVPDALGRTFTLKELVRRGRATGPRKAEEPVSDWLERISVGRTPALLVGEDPSDDVADPIGQGRRAFKRTAQELDPLCWALLDLLTGFDPDARPRGRR